MKRFIIPFILALFSAVMVSAQSSSAAVLRKEWRADADFSFSVSGFVARTVLNIAGEDEIRKAIRGVRRIRFCILHKDASGKCDALRKIKTVVKEEAFDKLLRMRDGEDDVMVYTKMKRRNNNRYLLLVDGPNEVVVMEVKGYIDMQRLQEAINGPSQAKY